MDGLVIARGDVEDLLEQAVQKQTEIGCEKLLLEMGSTVWKTIQELIDMNNPQSPKRTAMAWMNTATHQLLKFSLRCWKERNRKIHGENLQEQKAIALQQARDRITETYPNPPELDQQFRPIHAIPLAHRLKMPLQAAERLARQQAKECNEPEMPRKAHCRAVQAAVKDMREKLYARRSTSKPSTKRRPRGRQPSVRVCDRTHSRLLDQRPSQRYHPP